MSMSAGTEALLLRRTNGIPRWRRSSATTAKRCGWRGTITDRVPGGSGVAASASSSIASSPSRVEAATHTGRAAPKRTLNSRPNASMPSGVLASNLRFPVTAGDGAPRSASRLASTCVCAATPDNAASIGRESEGTRA